jgi:hypothetical protein
MATKNSRRPAAAKPRALAPTPMTWEWAADLNRQQLAAASESACALFRGFEVIRRIQEQAAHAAAERHAAPAGQMLSRTTPADLAMLQAVVVGEDLASAARYWQELANATLEMNAEILNSALQMVNTEDVLSATSALFAHS